MEAVYFVTFILTGVCVVHLSELLIKYLWGKLRGRR